MRFEIRKRHEYIGPVRTKIYLDENDRPYTANAPQRAFAASRRDPSLIRWGKAWQAKAIQLGFFFERDALSGDNHVTIIPLENGEERWRSDQHVVDWLEGERQLDRYKNFAIIALNFIRQQDQYGYSGVWEKTVEFYDGKLLWYKRYMAEHEQRFERNNVSSLQQSKRMRDKHEAEALQAALASESNAAVIFRNRLKKVEADWSK